MYTFIKTPYYISSTFRIIFHLNDNKTYTEETEDGHLSVNSINSKSNRFSLTTALLPFRAGIAVIDNGSQEILTT